MIAAAEVNAEMMVGVSNDTTRPNLKIPINIRNTPTINANNAAIVTCSAEVKSDGISADTALIAAAHRSESTATGPTASTRPVPQRRIQIQGL